MNKKLIIEKTKRFASQKLSTDRSGHDWWHTYRVWQLAKRLAKIEGADSFIVELSALLHDISDWKFNEGDELIGADIAKKWLKKLKVHDLIINKVHDAIIGTSFKGSSVKINIPSLEGRILWDADKLDAIGAIGIARGFMFAGNRNLTMYDPKKKPARSIKEELYKNYKRPNYTQINHFYEALLLYKSLMHTDTAKKIATKRHSAMTRFLKDFFLEWEGKQ